MSEDLQFGVLTIQNLPWAKEVERWKLYYSIAESGELFLIPKRFFGV